MPSPVFHGSQPSPTQALTNPIGNSHTSQPRSPAWKSVFRFANSSSKKLTVNGNGPPLTLDTKVVHSKPNGINRHPFPPQSILSMERKSSLNSSSNNSRSSSFNCGASGPSHHGPDYHTSISSHLQPPSDAPSFDSSTKSRTRAKSEKQRRNPGRSSARTKAQTANPSQTSFGAPSSPSRPTVAKGMGVATRFLRRVASAPNTKNLFSGSSRNSSGVTTKNGLLAPSDPLPPVPPVKCGSSGPKTDSLETMSSGSSRGRSGRPLRTLSAAPLPKPRLNNNGTIEKAAFRRTYSSNSIKVRQVGGVFLQRQGYC
jgi:protein-serine/threonine kinase